MDREQFTNTLKAAGYRIDYASRGAGWYTAPGQPTVGVDLYGMFTLDNGKTWHSHKTTCLHAATSRLPGYQCSECAPTELLQQNGTR